MPKQLTVISYGLREAFQRGLTHYKIIFLSAGPGWGKTAAVKKLLERQSAVFLSLREKPLPSRFSKARAVVLDDFQNLPPQAEGPLREILRKSWPGQHFVLISRGPLPEYLSPYEASGVLLWLEEGDLALDAECLARLAQARSLSLSAEDLQRLRDETGGCPAAAGLLLQILFAGQPFQKPAVDAMHRKMGAYLEEALLRPLDPGARKLLSDLALFRQFDQTLAELLTGDKAAARSALEALGREGGLLRRTGTLWQIADQRFLLPYLRQKLLFGRSEEHIRSLHLAGGRWHALRQDLRGALYHFQQADSRADMLEILLQTARRHPGAGACYEMRDYYDLLTDEEIRSFPDLICAMSMLRSMTFETEESERWYAVLKEHVRSMDPRDSDYCRVLGLQFYLEIGLPHRGISGLEKKIPAACKLLASKKLALPEMCVTGNLPSLLRGAKDLSQWTLKDTLLYDSIRVPAEAVFGRYGLGLGEIALTESLLEKGDDVSGRLLTLAALQENLRTRGTPEMGFVLTALLVRTLLSAGNPGKARELLERFRAEALEAGAIRLLPNIDAMRCRLSLMEGSPFASVWFSRQAPGEEAFSGAERYRCLTKARCCIKYREYHPALLLLGRVLEDARRYDRPLDMLETLVLISICRHRMESPDWREHFARALELGANYGYVAVFAREGAALLPLLEHYGRETAAPDYWERILSAAVTYAGYYGSYLRPPDVPLARLTQRETMILRLIGQDKSNEEICSLLHIKMPTAKTHVRNLFKKLGTGSRAEAQKAARRLGLVCESGFSSLPPPWP